MKKTPFRGPLSASRSLAQSGAWVLRYDHNGAKALVNDRKHIEYAAEAINMHEAMVAMLRALEIKGPVEMHETGHFTPTCPCCRGQYDGHSGVVDHAPDCALDALLKEENRDG